MADTQAPVMCKEERQAPRFVSKADKAQDIFGENSCCPVLNAGQFPAVTPSASQKPPPPKPQPIGLPKFEKAAFWFL